MGQVSAEEREAFAAHAATCPACAAEWRLARAFAEEAGDIASVAPRRRAVVAWRSAAAAAAVGIALLAVLFPREARHDGDPAYRESAGQAVVSRVPDGASLPREAFLLRWDAPGPDFRYDLRVFDGRLRLLHEEKGLTVTEATVPALALSALAPDAVVLWQIEAIGSDGNRLVSRTFRARAGP
jgi:hypothetical protein